MMYLDVWRSAHSRKTASKQVHYRLQTRTVERLSNRHQTVLVPLLGFRNPLYSCTEGMCHSSIRPGTSYHVTQFYQAFPRVSTVLQATNAGARRPGYEASWNARKGQFWGTSDSYLWQWIPWVLGSSMWAVRGREACQTGCLFSDWVIALLHSKGLRLEIQVGICSLCFYPHSTQWCGSASSGLTWKG